MARAVGIDLGTTNSVIAVLEGGEPTVITNAEGARTTPSVVAFAKDGEVLVGELARRQAVTNAERTISSAKRYMGTGWTFSVDGKRFTPQQISAFVLQKLKRDAEAYLGEKVTEAVITVPAYFNDAQRQATKEAGEIAGLNVLRIINEPTAAALAYEVDHDDDATIIMLHFGGGTFDVSLLEIGDGIVEVKATSGDNHLGGDDWDRALVDHLVVRFHGVHGVHLHTEPMALERLREAAEKAKIELSSASETRITLPYIAHRNGDPLHLDETMTRSGFQQLTRPLLDRCRAPFQSVMKDAFVKIKDVDHVVLVGGSTRMPAVTELIRELTEGKEPTKGVNPDEVVAIGASLQAGVLKGQIKDTLLLDVVPLSLGIETKGGIMSKFIERNTTIPTKRSEIFTTGGGTSLVGGSSDGTSPPAPAPRKRRRGAGAAENDQPAEDNQQSVQIPVYQGEREIAAYNTRLGIVELALPQPAPLGVPQIEVTFDIDANGIVHVSAKDLGTGKQQSTTITGGSALPKEDIDRMMREAEQYAEEDRTRREDAEVRNQAESLVYQTEKFIADNTGKVPAEARKVRDALRDLKNALRGSDIETIRTASEKAATTNQKLGAALYAQTLYAQTSEAAAANESGAAANDDVVDAEVVDGPVTIVPRELKVVVLGEGTVGKTTLVAALCGDPFSDHDQTHGIVVRPRHVPDPHAETDMTLWFWDFGGQPVYRTTHQFFYSPDALYLAVWNARAGQDKDDLHGWLERIRIRLGGYGHVMVVATHCDQTRPDVDPERLRRSYPGMFAGFHPVDSKSGTGIADLKSAITRYCDVIHPVAAVFRPEWIAARDDILALAAQEPQIDYRTFIEVCARHSLDEQDARALGEALHSLGRIIHHGSEDGLRDVVILNPEWLSKAIGRVLTDEVTLAANGVLDHARLPEIWGDRPDEPGYSVKHYPYFLRLMEKFDISYRLEEGSRSLVAPMVPRYPPRLPWTSGTPVEDGVRKLTVIMSFTEPAPGLISALTVRLHESSTETHWRDGVFLRHPNPDYASEALIRLVRHTGLVIEVRAPSPDYYFHVLHDHVEHLLARRWPGLDYRRLVPCPTRAEDGAPCAGRFRLDRLTEARQRGVPALLCPECFVQHDATEMLTGFPPPLTHVHDLEVIYGQLHDIQEGVDLIGRGVRDLQADAANSAFALRRLMVMLSTEITDCPRLFTLIPLPPSGASRLKIHQDRYRLTLWCEQPGHWHPWPEAAYTCERSKEWFQRISHYARPVLGILRRAVPLAGALAGIALDPAQLAYAQRELDLTQALLDQIPEATPRSEHADMPDNIVEEPTTAAGSDLRAVRALLLELDGQRHFGGLTRVTANSGEYLWVCPGHASEHDPGLPAIESFRARTTSP